MTEGEWLCSENSASLLCQAGGRLSERKLRLFLCACCREVWDLVLHPLLKVRERIGRTEDCIEGIISVVDLRAFLESTPQYASTPSIGPISDRIAYAVFLTSHFTPLALSNARDVLDSLAMAHENTSRRFAIRKAQCNLLRDIVGNPFRPAVLMDLAWQTPTVFSLAQTSHDERQLPSGYLDLARLAVLSDALEEAGCNNAEILEHLRSPGPHVRGCWALDLILGKS